MIDRAGKPVHHRLEACATKPNSGTGSGLR
jgi:hypothetical protein